MISKQLLKLQVQLRKGIIKSFKTNKYLKTQFHSSLMDYFVSNKRVQKLTPQSELRDYLDSPVLENLDDSPLDWWFLKKNKYTTLTPVALELLTIPVSSVASERTVSTLNRVLSDRRSRLTNDNINKLVVLISMPTSLWESYIGVELPSLDEKKTADTTN